MKKLLALVFLLSSVFAGQAALADSHGDGNGNGKGKAKGKPSFVEKKHRAHAEWKREKAYEKEYKKRHKDADRDDDDIWSRRRDDDRRRGEDRRREDERWERSRRDESRKDENRSLGDIIRERTQTQNQ